MVLNVKTIIGNKHESNPATLPYARRRSGAMLDIKSAGSLRGKSVKPGSIPPGPRRMLTGW